MQRELIKNREDRESLAVLSWFDCSHDLLDLALLEAGELEQARAVWRPELPIRPDYFWLRWACVRGEVAVRLGDREVARRSYAELAPWRGCFAGLETGPLSLRPVDTTLAALADLLDDPLAADRHRPDGLRLEGRVGAVPWSTRALPADDVAAWPNGGSPESALTAPTAVAVVPTRRGTQESHR
ncbi:hypothetical protein AB0J68_11045 [Micromonospora sp. NPDC049580]|uniref:hypothetical protein n=1 Tax=Micromonospora sp. NPDC049580 TaxID=3154832 RepID=UPI00342A2982